MVVRYRGRACAVLWHHRDRELLNLLGRDRRRPEESVLSRLARVRRRLLVMVVVVHVVVVDVVLLCANRLHGLRPSRRLCSQRRHYVLTAATTDGHLRLVTQATCRTLDIAE